MINSQLPKILSHERQDDTAVWQLWVDKSLPFFDGHFPEQAVLPGVTQLDWAITLSCQTFGYSSEVASIEVLKFQQIILPDTQVQLTVTHQAAKQKITFQFASDDHKYASGRVVFNISNTADGTTSK